MRANLGLHAHLEAGEVSWGVVYKLLDLFGAERRVGLQAGFRHARECRLGDLEPGLEGVVAPKPVRDRVRMLDIGESSIGDLEVIVGVTPSTEAANRVRVGEEGAVLDILVVCGDARGEQWPRCIYA